MRCRYCGKELALFKRLTGGGGFCSDAHKQSYQDEYNQLALGRLLQAQKKGRTEPSGTITGSSPAAPVAVEESAAAESVLEERAAAAPIRESAPLEVSRLEASAAEERAARDAPARETEQSRPAALRATLGEERAARDAPARETEQSRPAALRATLGEERVARDAPARETEQSRPAALRATSGEERVARDAPAEAPAKPDAEPFEIANFLIDGPAMAALPDETPPHLEPWLEFSSGPAVGDWQFQDKASTLSTAALVSLDLQPNASPAEHTVAPANLTPREFNTREFNNGHGHSTLPWKLNPVHQLPSAGPVSIEVTPGAIDFATDRSISGELNFETAVSVEDSRLLELPSTGIEFPTEDSGVILACSQDHAAAIDSAPPEAAAAAPVEDDSPRASLEALSRLHQDLTQEALVQDDLVPPEEPERAPGEPTPRRATDLLDIAIRMFPPAKAVPIEGAGLGSQSEPLLPHLKSLPLRPKVAVASGYAPPPTAPAQPQATAGAPQTAPRPAVGSKPAPAARPAARMVQPKQPPAPVKTPEPSKTTAKFQPPAQAAGSKTAPPSPARPETGSTKTDATEPAAKPPAGKEPAAIAASVKAAGQPAKPVVEETAKEISKAGAKQPPIQSAKRRNEPTPETVPNFGAVQLANPSFAGSLKVKLGIAIALLVVVCSTWLGWGGRSHKPASDSAISADGSGPSIIMGEGGWVEGWAGDPSGVHSGRQITIYRPSLKLSDYRVEFQASIETQSIGWVFRAADPYNYYAVKLMEVSSGLSPKVALFKYLVINGRQTQVGRVPIDLAVRTDTLFNIRTDVQGPQFSTYIQGRLADVWTDDQLKVGGVGFLNEREERGKVKSVSIRYLNGAGSTSRGGNGKE
jgi:hypothetical protein